MKRCQHCKVEKPWTDFHKNRCKTDGYQHYCKVCSRKYRDRPELQAAKNARSRELYWATRRTPEAIQKRKERYARRRTSGVRRYDWAKSVYDLSRVEYDALRTRDANCPGCLTPHVGGLTEHIDHDHVTGRVRGILCRGCNIALGGAKDVPETLDRLAAYLRNSVT